MRKIRPFGNKSTAADQGIDMDYLIGWFEDMIRDEEDRNHPLVAKAYDALQLLNDISEGNLK